VVEPRLFSYDKIYVANITVEYKNMFSDKIKYVAIVNMFKLCWKKLWIMPENENEGVPIMD